MLKHLNKKNSIVSGKKTNGRINIVKKLKTIKLIWL